MKHTITLIFALLIGFAAHSQCYETMPYSENFDGSDWVIDAATQGIGTIDSCWTRISNPATGYEWAPGPQSFTNNFTGAANDHTTGTGKYMYTNWTGGFTPSAINARFESPFISLVGATSPELRFWYHMFGSGIGTLKAQVNAGSGWINLDTKTGQQQISNTANWQEEVLDLSSYVGDTVRVRFLATRTSFSTLARICVDDVSVAEAPTCPEPTGLYTANTTANSTNFGWVVAPSDTFEIQYGTAGFTLGSGTIIQAAANPQTITGLAGSTTYAFYVRKICSPTDQSTWAGPIYTTTSCTGPAAAPYFENFDNPRWQTLTTFPLTPGDMAPCWIDNPSAQGNYLWLVNPNGLNTFQSGPNGDHTTGAGKYVATERWGFATNNSASLRTQAIDVTTVSNPEMSFWYHMYGSDIDKLEVKVKKVGSPYINVLTITGEQQTSPSDPWQEETISLAQFANDTIFIQFKGYRTANGFSTVIAVDDLSIYSGPACPRPGNLTASNLGITSVDLSWLGGVGAGNYEIKYGNPGFDPDVTGTSVSSTGSPETITGLTQGTAYDFYVRKFCTGSDTSFWEGPLTISTFCLKSAPYAQNFDGNSWVKPVNFNDEGEIDDCFIRNTNPLYIWTPGPDQFPSFQTGPDFDHTTGTSSGKFMFTNSISFGVNPPNANLITDFIDLTTIDTPQLSFWYHMFGNQIGSLNVEINDGSGWTNIFTKTGQQQTSKADNWEEAIVNLVNYVDDTVRFRFSATKTQNGFNSEIAIDDIKVDELPSCPKPSNLAFSALTFNSSTISWTTGGASNWQIQYGPANGTNTIIGVTTNPFKLTGLIQDTRYNVWVRDSCGAGDVSNWVGPISFKTQCSPTAAPYSQGFEGTDWETWSFTNQAGDIDGCYRRSDTTGYYWVPGPGQFAGFQTGPSAAASGSKYLMSRPGGGFGSGNSTTFRTTWIDVSSLTAAELRYEYHMYGINIDKLEILAQPYEGSPQLLKTLTGQSQTSSTAAWIQDVVSLSSISSDTLRLVFVAHRTANGFRAQIAIDEIEVSNPQVCNAPLALSTSNPTPSSIQVNWTSTASGVGSNIEYGLTGFSPGSGTIIYGVTSPHTVTGLMGNTAYDFYVQDSCIWGSTSLWAGSTSGTTQNCPSVTASFTETITNLNVVFDGSGSSGSNLDYLWDFGDGNIDSVQNPTNAYANSGTYTVTLIVTNDCGSTDTTTTTITICEQLDAIFSFNTSGLASLFNAASSIGSNLTFDWVFGDGTSGTGGTINHIYGTDGSYTVTLTITDACGNVDTLSQTVTVCSPLVASLNYTQNGVQVDFDGSATTGANSYFWNFGDGNTDTVAAPSHTYTSTGTYQITLIVTNICGESDTTSIVLTLCNTPVADWTFNIISSSGSGMVVQFDGTASVGANSFLWEFGDGNTNNTSAIPQHTYAVPGLFYVVKLTVANDCGDENQLSRSLASVGIDDFVLSDVQVYPNPVDDFVTLVLPDYIQVQSVQITRMDGAQFPVNTSVNGGVLQAETRHLAEGTYVLEVNTDVGIGQYKLIVRH